MNASTLKAFLNVLRVEFHASQSETRRDHLSAAIWSLSFAINHASEGNTERAADNLSDALRFVRAARLSAQS